MNTITANPKKLTYYVKTTTYSENYINKLFPSKKWIRVKDEDLIKYKTLNRPIDYIYVDEDYYSDKATYGVQSIVKNIVGDDKRQITFKHNLTTNLSRLPQATKYIMPQFEMDLMNYINPKKHDLWYNRLIKYYSKHKIYIFKAVSECAGRGIKIISNFGELMQYINKIVKEYRNKWENKTDPVLQRKRIWVLQEYLADPLLLNGYKFHIRHYLFYVPGGTSYYLDTGAIAVAREKYTRGNWHNQKIHDTHFYGNAGDIFPDELNLPQNILNSINKQIADLYSQVLKCVNASCYSENKKCYELLGVDLMITNDYKVKVIEINTKLGMPPESTLRGQIIFEGSLNKIVLPMLGLPSSEIPKNYTEHFIAIREFRKSYNKSKTRKSNTKHISKHKSTLKYT